MRKVASMLLFLGALLCWTVPAFAQETAAAGTTPANMHHWVAISSGFAMAIASGLCGLGQAKAIASSAEGMARNPAAAGAIRIALIIGLAFIESLALYTLVIVFIKVT